MVNERDALLGDQEQRSAYTEPVIEREGLVLVQHSNVDDDAVQKESPTGKIGWILFALWSAGEPSSK